VIENAWIDAVVVIKNNEVLTILNGMPTRAVFLADLDNDSKYEIYTNVFLGSGMISEEIIGYNIALRESYHLSMRGEKDVSLFIEEGILKSKVRPCKSNPNDFNVVFELNLDSHELSLD
jgi:hypothetical protein